MLRGLELVAVLDDLSEGLVITTLDGESAHWNRAALEMHGYAHRDEVPGLAAWTTAYRLSTLDGRELSRAEWPIARLLQGDDVPSQDLRLERTDRPWSRVFCVRGEILHGPERPLALLHLTDVTERDLRERELARERDRQALLLTAARALVGAARLDSPEVVALHRAVLAHLDADIMFHTRLRTAKGPLEKVVSLGVDGDDLLSKRGLADTFSGEVAITGASLVVDADRLSRDPRGAQTRRLGGRSYAGYALRARDGRVLGTLSFIRARADTFAADETRLLETYAHLVATAMERIDAEHALRNRDTQLRLVLEQAPVVLWSTNRDRKLTLLGGQALRRMGGDGGGAIGSTLMEVTPEPALAARMDDRDRRALAGEELHYDEDFGGVTVRAVVMPLRDDAGAVVGTVGVGVDVTTSRAAEVAIRAANAALEERVTARTAELRAANAELESFAYAVAHDLRAPLRAVAGFTRAVLEDHGHRLPADGQDMLGDVIAASHTASDLIDGLLALSRLTRGELNHDVIDLSSLGRDLIRELQRSEPDRAVEVTIESGLEARGDRRLIEALLRNLLQNAWKYTTRTAPARIALRAETRDEVPGFAIADNGAGFSMEHAGKLFLPFQRLHRQDEFPGLGLGLATVLRVVRRHGGTIVGTGTPGAGAIFWFTLSPSERGTP